jgi:integrase/recombinase XerD
MPFKIVTTVVSINARLVQVLARHKHLSTTQRYIDVNESKLRGAIELI